MTELSLIPQRPPRRAPGAKLCWLALLLAGVFASGCRSTQPMAEPDRVLPDAFPNHSADQILGRLRLTADDIHSFSARASLTIESPKRGGRFSSDVRSRQGDSTLITISPGLGIEAVRVLATRDSLYLYDRLKNEITYGPLADAAGMLGLPSDAESLFRNLLGLLAPAAETDWQIDADSLHYFLTSPDGSETITVDPALWRVIRYRKTAPDGSLLEERSFSDWGEVDGLVIPGHVHFSRPPEETAITLDYRSVRLNPGSLSFDLRASASARMKRL